MFNDENLPPALEQDEHEAKRVRELFIYEPNTGKFYVRKNVWRYKKGQELKMTATGGTGYFRLSYDNKRRYAHRVAFLYMVGRWPGEVDHLNHIKTDNRWKNLREVTRREQATNMKRSKANTSGVTGVCWDEWSQRWSAVIMCKNKHIRIGRFDTLEEAAKARKEAEKRYGFHKNHGRAHV